MSTNWELGAGSAEQQSPASSRRTWRFCGSAGNYLVVQGWDLKAEEANARLSGKLVLGSIRAGNSSLFTQKLLKELYKAATGIRLDLQLGTSVQLKIELSGLKKGDRLIYVDKTDSSRRIVYQYGYPPTLIDSKTWND